MTHLFYNSLGVWLSLDLHFILAGFAKQRKQQPTLATGCSHLLFWYAYVCVCHLLSSLYKLGTRSCCDPTAPDSFTVCSRAQAPETESALLWWAVADAVWTRYSLGSSSFFSSATPLVLLPCSAGVIFPFVAHPLENTSKSLIRHKKKGICLGCN